jgi:hypothetical protein
MTETPDADPRAGGERSDVETAMATDSTDGQTEDASGDAATAARNDAAEATVEGDRGPHGPV